MPDKDALEINSFLGGLEVNQGFKDKSKLV